MTKKDQIIQFTKENDLSKFSTKTSMHIYFCNRYHVQVSYVRFINVLKEVVGTTDSEDSSKVTFKSIYDVERYCKKMMKKHIEITVEPTLADYLAARIQSDEEFLAERQKALHSQTVTYTPY